MSKTVKIDIEANGAKASNVFEGLAKQLEAFGKTISETGNNLTSSLSKISPKMVAIGNVLANVITKVAQVVKQHLDDAIARFDTLTNFSKVMGNLGISATSSGNAVSYLSDQLTGLPTTLDSAVDAVKQFTAVNGNVEGSTAMYLALNDALLAGGASAEVQANAMEMLTKAYAKGKFSSYEWSAIVKAMPAQLKAVANEMGYTSTAIGGDLYNALQDGKVSMNDFMNTVYKLDKEGGQGMASFADQAKDATGGVATSITNMKTAFTRGLTSIIAELNGAGGSISSVLGGITKAINVVMTYAAALTRIVKEAVAWLLALFGFKGNSSSLVKSTGDASANMSGLAGSAGDASDGLADANKNAKKLKQTLAGFDEMNVLKEPEASGSSAGAGTAGSLNGALGDFQIDGSMLTESTDEIGKAVEKIKKLFSDLFGSFDTKKIGNALKSFYDSVKKFIGKAGKIFGDVWNSYLKPFFNWAGNDLLPAFLNAVGGALEFIGAIAEVLYTSVLKPILDVVIKPLAGAIGGAVVAILNGIGDAMKWVANNQPLLDFLGTLLKLFLAFEAVKFVTGFFVGLNNALSATKIALDTLPSILNATSTGLSAFTAGGASATTMIEKLKLVAGGVTGAISNLGSGLSSAINGFTGAAQGSQLFVSSLGAGLIIIEAVVAAVMALYLAFEWLKLNEENARLEAEQHKTTEQLLTETEERHNECLERQAYHLEKIKGLTEELTNSKQNMINAQKRLNSDTERANEVSAQYGMTLEEARAYVENLDFASGNLTEKDLALAEAVLDLTESETNLTHAKEELANKTSELTAEQERADEQTRGLIATQKQAELQTLLNEGKYEELRQKMVELTETGYEYTSANGENVKVMGEDVKNLVDFFGDQLARGEDDNARAWNKMWNDAGRSIDTLGENAVQNAAMKLRTGGQQGGEGYATGVQSGVQNKQGGVFSFIGNFASGVVNTFKNFFGIHSPSRLMAEMGGYIDEGLEKGIDDGAGSVGDTMTSLGETMTDALADSTSGLSQAFDAGALADDIDAGDVAGTFADDLDNPGVWESAVAVFEGLGQRLGSALAGGFRAVFNSEMGSYTLPAFATADGANTSVMRGNSAGGIDPVGFVDELVDKLVDALPGRGDDDEPIHLTVQIGDDTLTDKIIENVRERSKIRNRNVLMI